MQPSQRANFRMTVATVASGVYGLGTVGSATVTILRSRAEELAAQYHLRFSIRHIVVRDPLKPRTVETDGMCLRPISCAPSTTPRCRSW